MKTENRTGPVGRLARLLIAVGMSFALYSVADQGGPASFRDSSNLTEPITWVLHGAMLVVFVLFAGHLAGALTGPAAARSWQRRAFIGLVVLLAAAAVAAWVASGSIWASPLPELVWAFDAAMLIETIVALLIAIALGTPGCEVGVWPELIARRRGADAVTPTRTICVIGLHFIDDWEARRSRGPANAQRSIGSRADEA